VKIAAFWDVAACSVVEVDDVSEVCTASIIRAMSKSISTRLHGATPQEALVLFQLQDLKLVFHLFVWHS
jgi:hypothetical protein